MANTFQNSALVRDQNAQVISNAEVIWASSNAAVATVNSTGLITATGVGQCIITAQSGSVMAACKVTVS